MSKSSFLQHLDQGDFLTRCSKEVVDAYLQDWFYFAADGTRFYKIPAVSVHAGRTQFIGGRHRTAVLLKHLDSFPLAFDTRYLAGDDRMWIESIVGGPIDADTVIELPDLPIKSSLP